MMLLPVRPKYVDLILSGKKRCEIRRNWLKRVPSVFYVYETKRAKAFVGAAFVDGVEKVTFSSLKDTVGNREYALAEDYFRSRRFKGKDHWTVIRIKNTLQFPRHVLTAHMQKCWPSRRSLRYLSTELCLFELEKHSLEAVQDEEVKLTPFDNPQLEDRIDTAIVAEISPFYDDLTRGFEASHIPSSVGMMPSVGFSSLVKWAHAIMHRGVAVGKVVVTAKRSRAAKIGPIYVLSPHRNQGIGTAAIRLLKTYLARLGYMTTFATVPQGNTPANRIFEKNEYLVSTVLKSQYSCGSDEVVYHNPSGPRVQPDMAFQRKYEQRVLDRSFRDPKQDAPRLMEYWTNSHFFPTDADWLKWLGSPEADLETFRGKPHEIVYDSEKDGLCSSLLIYKRGGAMKCIPASVGASEDLIRTHVKQILRLAGARAMRKVYAFLPAEVSSSALGGVLESSGFYLEGQIRAGEYSLYESVSVMSRLL